MTAIKTAGAPETLLWSCIDWDKTNSHVRRLQLRIAKAVREKKWNKVKSLQHLLSKSFYAKLLSVHRVTSNRGSKTAGIDQEIWKTDEQKTQGLCQLKARGYKPQALRRIYIQKSSSNKKRGLSIPTMKDRAMQALYLLTLEPVSEELADKSSYGFRPKRSAHDAIAYCRVCLNQDNRAKWVLDADIEGCFDNISHDWLLNNIPMNKTILKKWLQSGYIYKEKYASEDKGTPQGGIISPVLANLTLDGLQNHLRKNSHKQDKINLIRYADDIVVTGRSKEILQERVIPAIKNFLSVRGLNLSKEKTKIIHIDEGFDFLGFNLRKFNGKMIISPSKRSLVNLVRSIKARCKTHNSSTQEKLIQAINPRLRGWCYYYRHVCSKKSFSKIDHLVLWRVFRWSKRKHKNKSWKWVKSKYFKSIGFNNWVFSGTDNPPLFSLSRVKIKRYMLVRHEANVYETKYDKYFSARDKHGKTYSWVRCKSQCLNKA